MVRLSRLWVGVLGVFVMMMLAAPASAQTGGLRGKVTDAAGKPVEGATVSSRPRASRGSSRSRRTRRASSSRSVCTPASTRSSAEKEGKVAVADNFRVGLGDPAVLDLQLSAGAPASAAEQQKKMAELQAAFDAGVAASKAQNWDEADRGVPEGRRDRAELPRLLLQHRLRLLPEEGLRQTPRSRTRRPPRSSRITSKRGMRSPTCTTSQKKLDEALAASNKAAELSQAAAAGAAARRAAAGATRGRSTTRA